MRAYLATIHFRALNDHNRETVQVEKAHLFCDFSVEIPEDFGETSSRWATCARTWINGPNVQGQACYIV